jgi:hypothetical protein
MPSEDVKCVGVEQRSRSRIAYVEYFVFNEDFGVTAYGITDKPVSKWKEQIAITSQLVLKSEYGILCCKSKAKN